MGRQKELISANTATMAKRYRFTLTHGVFGTLVLRYAPDGWKDDEFTLTRNMRFFGVFQKFATLEMKFVKDGRDFIRDCYEAYGVNSDVTVKVEYYLNTGEWTTRFEGKVDFSTYKISEYSCSVQVKEFGFQDLILQRANIRTNILERYSIDGQAIYPADSNTVLIPDIRINANGFLSWDESIEDEYTSDHVVPVKLQLQKTFTECQTPEQNTASVDGCFFANAAGDYPGSLLVMYFGLRVDDGKRDFKIQVRRYRSMTWTTENEDSFDLTPFYGQLTYSKQITLDILTGDYYMVRIIDTDADDTFTYRRANISLMYAASTINSKVINGITYREAWRALVAKLTSNNDGIESTIFDDEFLGIIITGRFLRGIDGINPAVPVSVDDLFDALSIFNIGIGVNSSNQLEIERMEHFFNEYVCLDLSDRIKESTITKEVIPELFANRVIFGYNSYEYNNTGGVYEFNTQSEWSTAIKPINESFEVKSPYRADMAGVIKALSEDDQTADDDSDGEIFMFDCVEDETEDYRIRTSEGFDFVSGAIDPDEVFNMNYSPARTLRRWGSYIRAFLHQNLSSRLRWQASDKASSLVTQLDTEDAPVEENGDVLAADLEVNRWIPEAYTVTVPLEEPDLDQVRSNPLGIVKLSDTKFGWILNFRSRNDDRKSEYRLLRVNLAAVTPIPYLPGGFGKLYNYFAIADSRKIVRNATVSYQKTVKYGYLYNWYAVNNENGIAPDGWHVPTAAEWLTLINYVKGAGDYNDAAKDLKDENTVYWDYDEGLNTYGFYARGTGERLQDGSYAQLTDYGWWHSSDDYNNNLWGSYGMTIQDNQPSGTALQWTPAGVSTVKKIGMGLRLIKDNSTDTGTMTGNDGTVYPTVKIGTQVWMACNSIETMYRGEQAIPERPDAGEWPLDVQGSRCSYDNDEDNAFTLTETAYSWHVPTSEEWQSLIEYLGGTDVAGGKMKESGLKHWASPNTGATNDWILDFVGSGLRAYDDGTFYEFKTVFYCHSSDVPQDGTGSHGLIIYSASDDAVILDNDITAAEFSRYGFAIRLCRLSKQHEGATGIYIGNDGKRYPTVVVNGYEWTRQNLKETKYMNGDTIPEVSDNSGWIALATGAWCYYNNNPEND